jgi:hypothetical protein
MNGKVQITDLVISKLLRQNIEKYRALFPHVAAAIRLNVSGVITNRGDSIQYVHTDSDHTDPLQRITPAKFISSESYDKAKYLEMIFDSAEAVLSVFGFNRSLFGFDRKKTYQWWNEIYQQREKDIESSKSELWNDHGSAKQTMSLFPDEDVLTKEIETWRGFIDKLPTDEDKSILTKLLNDYYRYSIAMNDHAQEHPFTTKSLIMSLLLIQHRLINHLKSMIQSEQQNR